ncbi:MAG: thioredoxin family protein [Myxococcales bacterium]|jgi:thiol-disulfide isomerase/thioredoxin
MKATLISATWCGPCREFKKVIKKYAEKHPDEPRFEVVDADSKEGSALLKKHDSEGIPTLVITEGAKVLHVEVGGLSLAELEARMRKCQRKAQEHQGERKAKRGGAKKSGGKKATAKKAGAKRAGARKVG